MLRVYCSYDEDEGYVSNQPFSLQEAFDSKEEEKTKNNIAAEILDFVTSGMKQGQWVDLPRTFNRLDQSMMVQMAKFDAEIMGNWRLCDAGEKLQTTECLEVDNGVKRKGTNRCFFLSVLASLRARGEGAPNFAKVPLTKAKAACIRKIKGPGEKEGDFIDAGNPDMLRQLMTIMGSEDSVVVAVYAATEEGADSFQVQLKSCSGFRGTNQNVHVAHIVLFENLHFVALIPEVGPQSPADNRSAARPPEMHTESPARLALSRKGREHMKRKAKGSCIVCNTDIESDYVLCEQCMAY